jgi:NTP pyrophosphatase (non-canonical NTP hydrolase)
MNIKEMQKEVHQLAVEKGWWDQDRNGLEIIALIHSELSEAVEEMRKGEPPLYYESEESGNGYKTKPEGWLVELADAVIRIMDYCEQQGLSLQTAILMKHEYNKTRPVRHGGKLY